RQSNTVEADSVELCNIVLEATRHPNFPEFLSRRQRRDSSIVDTQLLAELVPLDKRIHAQQSHIPIQSVSF
ncbi:hypothetical protein CSUI_006402, partial [Cystoisospora suis]